MTNDLPTGPDTAISSASGASPGNLPNPQDPSGVDVGFPAGAVDALRQDQRQLDIHGEFVGVSRQALDEVLTWVNRFAVRPIAGTEGREVVGSMSELRFDSDDPFLTSLDLVRVNGRPFVPETPIAVDDDVVLLAKAAVALANIIGQDQEEKRTDADPSPYLVYLNLRRRLRAGRTMDVLRAIAADPGEETLESLFDEDGEEVTQTVEALRQWLEHDATCPAFAEPSDPCDCGLDEVVTALDPTADRPTARRWTGPGELETSGYLESGPEIGSAYERDAGGRPVHAGSTCHGQPLGDGVEP